MIAIINNKGTYFSDNEGFSHHKITRVKLLRLSDSGPPHPGEVFKVWKKKIKLPQTHWNLVIFYFF